MYKKTKKNKNVKIKDAKKWKWDKLKQECVDKGEKIVNEKLIKNKREKQ